jgi:hypothetical protein
MIRTTPASLDTNTLLLMFVNGAVCDPEEELLDPHPAITMANAANTTPRTYLF